MRDLSKVVNTNLKHKLKHRHCFLEERIKMLSRRHSKL